jgi:hypothetical protein
MVTGMALAQCHGGGVNRQKIRRFFLRAVKDVAFRGRVTSHRRSVLLFHRDQTCVSLQPYERAPAVKERADFRHHASGKGEHLSDAAFGEDTWIRMEALRREFQLPPRAPMQDGDDAVSIRRLRGATEYRGHREQLVASGQVLAAWLPGERLPGQRMRATLRARDGGRDVFARRLDDGRFCVLVIHTQIERVVQERFAFERFLWKAIRRG